MHEFLNQVLQKSCSCTDIISLYCKKCTTFRVNVPLDACLTQPRAHGPSLLSIIELIIGLGLQRLSYLPDTRVDTIRQEIADSSPHAT